MSRLDAQVSDTGSAIEVIVIPPADGGPLVSGTVSLVHPATDDVILSQDIEQRHIIADEAQGYWYITFTNPPAKHLAVQTNLTFDSVVDTQKVNVRVYEEDHILSD